MAVEEDGVGEMTLKVIVSNNTMSYYLYEFDMGNIGLNIWSYPFSFNTVIL